DAEIARRAGEKGSHEREGRPHPEGDPRSQPEVPGPGAAAAPRKVGYARGGAGPLPLKPRPLHRVREDHAGRPARAFLRSPRGEDPRRLPVAAADVGAYAATHGAAPRSEGESGLPHRNAPVKHESGSLSSRGNG